MQLKSTGAAVATRIAAISPLRGDCMRDEHMSTPSEILVVDDDVSSLTGLLSLLRNLGYRTTGAVDVVGGCALLEAFPFDMLITDIQLHRESGLKLIRRAREVRPAIAIVA